MSGAVKDVPLLMRGGRNQQIARAGEYFVAGELSKRGAYATPFAGNMPGIDLVAFNKARSRTVFIDVKARSPERSVGWQTSIVEERPAKQRNELLFAIFVDLGDADSPTRYWVVPTGWLRNEIYENYHAWLSRHGGQRPRNPSSKHHLIKESRLTEWIGRWDILGVCDVL